MDTLGVVSTVFFDGNNFLLDFAKSLHKGVWVCTEWKVFAPQVEILSFSASSYLKRRQEHFPELHRLQMYPLPLRTIP